MTNHVIDTHALIWYITADSRLGPTAKRVLDAGKNGGNLTFVSTISLVEIIYLQEKGKIPSHLFTQINRILRNGYFGLRLSDVTGDVVRALAQIQRSSIPDMPDRIIAATALHLGVPLISRDRRIQLSAITTVW